MGDTLEIFGKEFTNVAGFKAKDDNGNVLTYTRGGGGGTITIEEIPNATGTTLQITTNGSSSGGGSPSATQHTISLEFSDGTDVDIPVYYNDSLIGTMITNYAPNPWSYNSKNVLQASLDNVIWLDRSMTWETLLDTTDIGWFQSDNGTSDVYPYCWITSLGDVTPSIGSVWRVTYDGTQYIITAKAVTGPNTGSITVGIGNPKWLGGTDDGSNVPFCIGKYGNQSAWAGCANLDNSISSQYITMKIERAVTS